MTNKEQSILINTLIKQLNKLPSYMTNKEKKEFCRKKIMNYTKESFTLPKSNTLTSEHNTKLKSGCPYCGSNDYSRHHTFDICKDCGEKF